MLEIRRASGELIYSRARNEPPSPQVIPESVAADMNRMMGQVITAGTARNADLGYTPAAGKTGTTQSYRDAWFVGFTAKYVTGVWFGNDDYSPTNRATGGSLPAKTWKAFMLRADRAKAPVSLVGLPATQQHAAFLQENRNLLENIGGEDVQVAAVQTDDEAAGSATASSDSRDDAVVRVLRDMFTLFKNEEQKVRVVRPSNQVRTSNQASTSNNVRIISPGQFDNGSERRTFNARRLRQFIQTR